MCGNILPRSECDSDLQSTTTSYRRIGLLLPNATATKVCDMLPRRLKIIGVPPPPVKINPNAIADFIYISLGV